MYPYLHFEIERLITYYYKTSCINYNTYLDYFYIQDVSNCKKWVLGSIFLDIKLYILHTIRIKLTSVFKLIEYLL